MLNPQPLHQILTTPAPQNILEIWVMSFCIILCVDNYVLQYIYISVLAFLKLLDKFIPLNFNRKSKQ